MSTVRELDVGTITQAVTDLCITANYGLPPDVCAALTTAAEAEESPVGREVLMVLALRAVPSPASLPRVGAASASDCPR